MSSGSSPPSVREPLRKRLFDLAVGTGLLMVLAPVIAAAALAARIDTGASGFFAQERVRAGGQPFTIYKLRTMRRSGDQSSVTSSKDPRVTRLGAFLRRYKIDELPQLWNVVRGDMSLVGPRPTVREDYERMNARQRQRFRVKPGITGLAQTSGNTGLSWPERIEWDLEYVQNWTLKLDLRILAHTMALSFVGGLDTHPRGDDEWQ